MDDGEFTQRLSAMQGARPRTYQRRDGSWVVAYGDNAVTFVDKLTLIPRKTDLDRFEDALQSARDELETAIRIAIANADFRAIEDAFGTYDFNVFHALEALRP